MLPILALSISGSGIWSMLMTAIAAGAIGYLVVKKDSKIEERRSNAIETAALCKEMGMEELSDAFKKYAVGDYSGLISDLKAIAKIAANPDKVKERMTRNFFIQLPIRLNDPEERVKILKAIKAVEAADNVKTVLSEEK